MRAQHYGHRRREVFAMPGFYIEKKVRERIAAASLQIKRVYVIVAKVRLNCSRRVVTIAASGTLDDVLGQLPNPWIEFRRQFKISCELHEILKRICAKSARTRLCRVGIDCINDSFLIVRPSLN